jgi:hypothetical protein
MAQSGFTPIQIYSSSTTGNTPAAGNLLNSTGGAELAINIFDGKLFYKDSSGNVQVIGWKVVPVSAGGTGQTSYTDGQLLIGNSTGNTLTKATLTAGSGVTITNGAGAITINATGSGGTVTSVAASVPSFLSISGSPITTSGTLAITLSGTALPTTSGGTGLTAFTANGVVYASSTSALTTGSALIFDGTNLGIGVTLNTWASTVRAIEVGSWGAIGSSGTSGNAEYLNNAIQSTNGGAFVYKNNGPATKYTQALGLQSWSYAASGTAGNTISWTQAMTLHASGGLSLGNTTDPGATNLSVTGSVSSGGASIVKTNAANAFSITSSTGTNSAYQTFNNTGNTFYVGTDNSTGAALGFGAYAAGMFSSTKIVLQSGSASNLLTLDASGRLLIGQAVVSNSVNGLYLDPTGGGSANIVHASGTASGTGYAYFLYAGGSIGSITQNGTTGVLYNLTSDYRLKNNQEALTGSKDFIMALQPKKWQWWDGSGEGVGFVAHEFMEVAKYSGNGEKDATEEQKYEITPAIPAVLDEEGNEVTPAVEAVMGTRTVPIYQSIQPSSSEVMANIVAFIQEQQAMITNLTARLDTLEG